MQNYYSRLRYCSPAYVISFGSNKLIKILYRFGHFLCWQLQTRTGLYLFNSFPPSRELKESVDCLLTAAWGDRQPVSPDTWSPGILDSAGKDGLPPIFWACWHVSFLVGKKLQPTTVCVWEFACLSAHNQSRTRLVVKATAGKPITKEGMPGTCIAHHQEGL